MEEKPIKFNIVSGNLVHDEVEKPYWAGNAYYYPEQDYFEMLLSIFERPWFLSPNHNRPGTYTIYRRKHSGGDFGQFSAPIGKAYYVDKDRSLLELIVPLWNPRYNVFLNLRESM